MRQSVLMVAIGLSTVLTPGCDERGSTPSMLSEVHPVLQTFTLEMKDSSGKAIGGGTISLPLDISERSHFAGAWKIRVSEVPSEPSSQQDYALLCLSQDDGALRGTVKADAIRINLHPGFDDRNIYLEGQLNDGRFRGQWYYASYAGYEEFGSFEGQREDIP